MKTFKDLEFKTHTYPVFGCLSTATINFPNNYGVYIVTGKVKPSTETKSYGLAILQNGNLCFNETVTNEDITEYLNEDEVTKYMKMIQELPY